MEVNNDTNQIDTSTPANENATPAHTFSSANLNISSQLTATAVPTPNTPPSSTPSASKSMKHFKKSMIVEYERIESNGGADEHSQSSTSSTSSSKSAASNHSSTPTSFANTAISSLNAAKSSPSANDNEELSHENNKRKRKLNEQSDHNLAANSDLYEDESVAGAGAGARANSDETKSFRLKREMDFSELSDNNARSEFESETGKEVKRKKSNEAATPKTSGSNPKSNKSNQNSSLEQRVGEADRNKPAKKEKDKEKANIYCICKSADTQRFMM